MKKEKKASTVRKAKMAMDKSRHRMVNNKSNMEKRDRITVKKVRIMASNNDFSRQLNTVNRIPYRLKSATVRRSAPEEVCV